LFRFSVGQLVIWSVTHLDLNVVYTHLHFLWLIRCSVNKIQSQSKLRADTIQTVKGRWTPFILPENSCSEPNSVHSEEDKRQPEDYARHPGGRNHDVSSMNCQPGLQRRHNRSQPVVAHNHQVENSSEKKRA